MFLVPVKIQSFIDARVSSIRLVVEFPKITFRSNIIFTFLMGVVVMLALFDFLSVYSV